MQRTERKAHGYPVIINTQTGLITHGTARSIAAEWHDNDELLTLASTGEVIPGINRVIAKLINVEAVDPTNDDLENLKDLLEYCMAHGDDSTF